MPRHVSTHLISLELSIALLLKYSDDVEKDLFVAQLEVIVQESQIKVRMLTHEAIRSTAKHKHFVAVFSSFSLVLLLEALAALQHLSEVVEGLCDSVKVFLSRNGHFKVGMDLRIQVLCDLVLDLLVGEQLITE